MIISDLIGKPFKWGARGPDAYDCAGLTEEVLSRYGIIWQRPSCDCQDPARIHESIVAEQSLGQWEEVAIDRPGDVVLTSTNNVWRHVCPVVEGGVLHVSKATTGVMLIPRSGLRLYGYQRQRVYRWLG